MKETKERKMENFKGITLIALVVTIVVLLILAGVSIGMLAGENGIIKQAQEAKNETKIGEEKDKVNFAVQAAKIGSDGLQKLTEANLAAELTKNIGKRDVDYTLVTSGEKFVVTYTDTGNGYIVDIDGTTTDRGKWYAEPGIDAEGNKTLKVTNGEITLEIGDYIDYDPLDGATQLSYTSEQEQNGYGDQVFTLKRAEGETETTVSYNGKWQVIGVSEEGQILIASEDLVIPTVGGYNSAYALKGQEGYKNAITELDNISKLYGQGYGAAGARSITVEDINKVTGYNPNNVGVYDPKQLGNGTSFAEGELREYGNEVTYYWNGTNYPYYKATNTLEGNLTTSCATNGFNWYENGWKTSAKSTTATTSAMEKITTLKSTFYYYYSQTLTTTSNTTATVGLVTDSKAYNALFINSSESAYSYWLGSNLILTYADPALYDHASFGVRYAGWGGVGNMR